MAYRIVSRLIPCDVCRTQCSIRLPKNDKRRLLVSKVCSDFKPAEDIEPLLLYWSEHERLKEQLNEILHSRGDAPANPSMCDLVAYVADLVNEVKIGKMTQP